MRRLKLLLGMLDYGYEKIQQRKKEIIRADMDLRDRLRLVFGNTTQGLFVV